MKKPYQPPRLTVFKVECTINIGSDTPDINIGDDITSGEYIYGD